MKNTRFVFIKELLYWTWCLPQTLLGLIVKLVLKGKRTLYYINNKIYVVYSAKADWLGGISLGKYVILGIGMDDGNTIKHEHGHQLQSFILGPLYLLVIGLPSGLWCWFIHDFINKQRRKKGKHLLSYYWLYPESWANKLGGINYKA